ncbi:MAG: preprotein translocase subunit SecG [Armatimonadetes bacterium CG_4_8_14_3_um_filter_58_9]|nr:MAG: preprotein translocase subunit SecG [Armatimonadetes bacterium CG_4_8_14_3_um_filter_58_9]
MKLGISHVRPIFMLGLQILQHSLPSGRGSGASGGWKIRQPTRRQLTRCVQQYYNADCRLTRELGMAILIEWIHSVSCIGLVAVIMFQTTKSEGGTGSMGWGTIGGKASSSLDVAVGIDRILKPLTFWLAVTFLVTAILNGAGEKTLGPMLAFVGPVYIVAMIWGRQALTWVKKAFGAE